LKENFLHRNSIREEREAVGLFKAKVPKYQATSCHILHNRKLGTATINSTLKLSYVLGSLQPFSIISCKFSLKVCCVSVRLLV